jgi:hypothetical protein
MRGRQVRSLLNNEMQQLRRTGDTDTPVCGHGSRRVRWNGEARQSWELICGGKVICHDMPFADTATAIEYLLGYGEVTTEHVRGRVEYRWHPYGAPQPVIDDNAPFGR